MSLSFSKYLIIVCLLFLSVKIGSAEEIIPDVSPTDALNLSSSPSEEDSAQPSPTIELEALDQWIKKKTKREHPEEKVENETGEDESGNPDQEALLAEEQEIYKGLVDSYQAKQRTTEVIQRIFHKTILSKKDQARIEKIKPIQARVRSDMKKTYEKMKLKRVEPDYPVRLCNLAYDIMGMPSDIKRSKPEVGKYVGGLWRKSLKQIGASSCDLIFVSGIYGKTTSKVEEFWNKSIKVLISVSGVPWTYTLASNARGASYAIAYKPSSFNLESSSQIDKISLRRGGVFEESEFSLPPSEMVFRDLQNGENRFRLILSDLVFDEKPFKEIELPHLMQMTSALREIVQIRHKSEPDTPVILMINNRFVPSHPAYYVLIGSVGLEDFLPNGGCQIVKKSEEKKFDSLECGESFKYKKRSLFNVYNDLFYPSPKASKKILTRVKQHKQSSTLGTFILQNDIPYVYTGNKKIKETAGLLKIREKDLKARLVWTDFHFKKEK